MPLAREVIHVSAGLARDGGGTALVARMIADTVDEFSRARGVPCRLLSLGPLDDESRTLPVENSSGSKGHLAWSVWRRQFSGRCQALVFDHPGPARLQTFVPRRFRSPYLVFLYGIDVWRRQTWAGCRSLSNATSVIAISDFTKRRAQGSIPGLDGIHVLPLALEERAPQGRTDDQVTERAGRGYLLIVGRMSASERYKGHDELLTALPGMLRAHPQARLVIVGEGDDRARLQGRAQELGLADSVYFTGFVDEATLVELYRNSCGLVMPSLEEGFGLVYLEAMQAAKPCIGARGSAAEEIILDGETGFLVDRDREDDLACACLRLLTEPSLAHELGEAGHRRWQATFRRTNFEQGLVRHLESLLRKPNVRD